jgi:DNA-binding beta-propeller fold protein YncE
VLVGLAAAVLGLAAHEASGQVTSRAFVSSDLSGRVYMIDNATLGPPTEIHAGGSATVAVAASPDGRRAYVTKANGNVAIIDVATSAFLSEVFLIQNIRGIAVSPDGSKVYVAHYGGGIGGTSVFVRDAQTLAPITTITVDDRPHAIAISGTQERERHVGWRRAGIGEQDVRLIAVPAANAAFGEPPGTTLVKMFTVPATSRFNVSVAGPASHVPELADEWFGAVIDSTQPIVVERSLYSNVGDVIWAAGSNATATRLP